MVDVFASGDTDTGRSFTVPTTDGALVRVWEYAAPQPGPSGETPTLVLAHGWTLNHTCWLDVIARVQAALPRVRVVAYDQPGHGESTAPDAREVSIRGLGSTLAEVVRVGVGTGPLVLAGHSMGGMSIMAFAGTHPMDLAERVVGVAFMGTSAGGLSSGRSWGLVESVGSRVLSFAPAIPTGHFITTGGQRESLFGVQARPEDVERTVRMMRATSLSTLGRYYLALMEHDETDSLPRLAGIPTTILAGSLDRLTSVRHARRLAEAIPHARFLEVAERGHMLMYEEPELVSAELVALLD